MGLGIWVVSKVSNSLNKHLVEIGCTDRANLHDFLEEDSLLEIFEPNPKHLEAIRAAYAGFNNVIIHPYALWKECGQLRFYSQGATSFVEGVMSPAVLNNLYVCDEKHVITVEARTYDEFDNGTVTMMDIDTEGAEWHVLEKMSSKPAVIMIEMEWVNYRNPHYDEIIKWMQQSLLSIQ